MYLVQKIENPILPPNLRVLTGVQFISRLLPALVSMLLVAGFVAFVFYFIFGAIKYITSGGDKGQVQSARESMMTAVIGVFLLIGAFGIINLIEIFFGFNITYFDIAGLKV